MVIKAPKPMKKTNMKQDQTDKKVDYIKKYKQHCNNAKQRGMRNSLTYEQYKTLCMMSCYLCKVNHGGVDRKDSELDYQLDNSEPCCSLCNSMKSSFDDELFINHVKIIAENN